MEAVAQEQQGKAGLTPGHRQASTSGLDVSGYGKCPEFVCVDGLIVSKDNGWQDSDSGQDQSLTISHQGTLSTLRSVAHDYEAVHNSTDAEESGIFKNFNFSQVESGGAGVASYNDIMKNNEDLLASHIAHGGQEMSDDGDRSNEGDTNNLVSTTHTSQVSVHASLQ